MLERIARFIQDHFIRGRRLNPARLVVESFALIILTGAILLTLPFATQSRESVGFFTALFTATSATCVTGLVLVDTAVTWSLFGKIVILGLIQLGGLGFMTVITILSFVFHRRIGLSERLLMVSTLNLNDLDGVVRVVRRALVGTAFFEGMGAFLLSFRMIPRFGFGRGIWYSIFHAISAFCNAGFDLMGIHSGQFSSLISFQKDPLVLLTIASLIIMGGLGFFVWEDVVRHRRWKKLTLYSKLAIGMTAGLLTFGTLFFLLVEGKNPATLGAMPMGERILNAFFQSATLRTAGFNVIDQGAMKDCSLVLCCMLMFIGGSSGSTAGGIKTVTFWVLSMVLITGLRGRSRIVFRERTLPAERIMNAVNLFLMVFTLLMSGSMFISLVDGVPYLHAAFETASALGTVGLTTGITSTLSWASRAVLILCMYLGRVGVLSVSIGFLTGKSESMKIKYPEFSIMIG